ncbi:MAG TPA: energy transducer TonB, partial [Bryobacteraceae bacterium]|nr:energy transducer TonB [Bryobacteraceae bacterium]
RAVILMDGSLGSITVLNAAPSELAAAAVEAASQWRYQPTLMNGKPVETETVIEMTYQLTP